MSYFKDKVAVILGCSAEGGMGYVAAQKLARHGAKVVVAARSFDKLQVLAENIGGYAVKCDVGKEDDIVALARAALHHYGRVDIAVNAAGMTVNGAIAAATVETLRIAVDVNYFGNVFFVREMAKAIGQDGAIVVFSSMSATHPVDGLFTYACAKAATDCMVRYAALEYGKCNIRVNSILPGSIWSHMTGETFSAPGVEATIAKEIPLGRLGQPEEAAEAVLWLCGPSYVTGLQIPVAGGQQLTRYPYAYEYPSGNAALDAADAVPVTESGA